jgi:hypothetical protein
MATSVRLAGQLIRERLATKKKLKIDFYAKIDHTIVSS